MLIDERQVVVIRPELAGQRARCVDGFSRCTFLGSLPISSSVMGIPSNNVLCSVPCTSPYSSSSSKVRPRLENLGSRHPKLVRRPNSGASDSPKVDVESMGDNDILLEGDEIVRECEIRGGGVVMGSVGLWSFVYKGGCAGWAEICL